MSVLTQCLYAWATSHPNAVSLLIGLATVFIFLVAAIVVSRMQRRPTQAPISDKAGYAGTPSIKVGLEPKKQPSPAEVQVYWNVKGEFDKLRWSQKIALQIVFRRSGIGPNELADNLAENMDFCGSGDSAFNRIVEPLLNTDLVRFVGPEVRINPSNCTFVEELLDEFRKVIV